MGIGVRQVGGEVMSSELYSLESGFGVVKLEAGLRGVQVGQSRRYIIEWFCLSFRVYRRM